MPPRDVRMFLADIVSACETILEIAGGLDEAGYRADKIKRQAIERNFEIVGEAMRRLLMVEPGLSLRLHESRDVIAFRNALAHGYFMIDPSIVWKTIQTDVPTLLYKSRELLAERDVQAGDA